MPSGSVGLLQLSMKWTQDGFPHLRQTRITLPHVRESQIDEENHWNSRSIIRLRGLCLPVVLEIDLVQLAHPSR